MAFDPVLAASGTGSGLTADSVPALDGARLLARIDQLGAIGALDGGGVTRLAYSAEDVSARELVAGWLREAGADVRVDAAGNLLATLAGTGQAAGALVSGSHLDTVVAGGTLDGAYGVVAAVAVLDALVAADSRLRHDFVVAAWSNEEGARGTPGMVGSRCAAGTFDEGALDVPDRDGTALRGRIAQAGGDADHLGDARWHSADFAGLIELHIEQGPVLDSHAQVIAAVDAITGQLVAELVLNGTSNHAGTTPMDLRSDAMTAAAEIVLAAERLALEGLVRTATCGALAATPGVRNVIAGRVVLSVDLRDVDDARLGTGWNTLQAAAAAVAERRKVGVSAHVISRVPPVQMDPVLLEVVEHAAAAGGFGCRRMPSGAGHDAQVLAALGPVAMIFVPSIGGVSHSPRERTDPEHLRAGAEVLLRALLAADEALGAG